MASHGKVCLRPRSGKQYSLQRAVAQLGSALEWGSRGRGFKSRRPDAAIECFIYMFCAVRRQVGGTLGRANMSRTGWLGIIAVNRKQPDTGRLGFWFTPRASVVVPKRSEEKSITKRGMVAMNSTAASRSAIAA